MTPAPDLTFYGRTLRGLEDWACEELAGRFGAKILGTGHREIFFSGVEAERLAGAGLLDDVFLLCGKIDGIDHTRASLDLLRRSAPRYQAAVHRALALRRPRGKALKVVASFLGKRNYNRFEIEAAVGEPLAPALGLQLFTGREEEADAVLRVHLREGAALLALRLFDRPLRQRTYKTVHLPAATPPQVGRALAARAGLQAGMHVLDPYCGTGTVLIEAGLLQPELRLYGGDLSPAALAGGRDDARTAGIAVSWQRMSALALAFRDRTFDRIVTNVPWGRQVSHAGEETAAWRELARVLRPEGRVSALVYQPEHRFPGFFLESEHWLRLYGQATWIVTLRPEASGR